MVILSVFATISVSAVQSQQFSYELMWNARFAESEKYTAEIEYLINEGVGKIQSSLLSEYDTTFALFGIITVVYVIIMIFKLNSIKKWQLFYEDVVSALNNYNERENSNGQEKAKEADDSMKQTMES